MSGLGVNNLPNNDGVQVYPNPVTNTLHILTPNTLTYKIQNVIGITVLHGTLKQGDNSISTQGLASGVYVLELMNKDGSASSPTMRVKVVKE